MIRKYDLPDEITLPCGATLKPVIGGHLAGKPFCVNAPEAGAIIDPDMFRGERTLIVCEAKRRRLKYRLVSVLSRNLRGKLDLYHRPYRPTLWVFVEVKPEAQPETPQTTSQPQG